MASDSPGAYLRSQDNKDNQDQAVISGKYLDVSGGLKKLQMDMAGDFQREIPFIGRDSGYYVNTSDGASTCSSSTAETWESEGASLLILETKSLRSFTTNDEYLFAMKEDLAEWFSCLYQNFDITADNFFQALETGVLLCKHANKVQEFARQYQELGESLEMKSYFIRSIPKGNVPYREGVKPETFQARDNVSNFISWARQLGIPEVLSFETDDLVLRKNEKSVILCLLEVARIGAKLGMLAPTLVQMEQEIDAELAGEEPQPQIQIKTCDMRSLDERVRDLIDRCTCPVQFPMIKVSEGKYKVGDTRNLIFVRILRNHVMVRVGGGWDTLENYLNKHDPCQCNYRGHKAGGAGVSHKVAVNAQRRSSISNNNSLRATPTASPSPRRMSSAAANSRSHSPSSQTSSRANSPTLMISRNIPASPKNSASPNNSVRGSRVVPSQNQQDVATEGWSNMSPRSSDSNLSSQPIRSSSPSPRQPHRTSPHTVLQNTTPQMSSLRPPSGVHKKDKGQANKTMTQRKSSVRSVTSEYERQEQITLDSNGCQQTSETEIPILSEETDFNSVTKTPSRSLEQASASVRSGDFTAGMLANTVTLGDFTSLIKEPQNDGYEHNREVMMEQPNAAGSGSSQALKRVPKKKTNTAFQDTTPKIQSSFSRTRTPALKSGNEQKLPSGLHKGQEKRHNTSSSKVQSHTDDGEVGNISGVVSEWLESTNRVDFANIKSDQPDIATVSNLQTVTSGNASQISDKNTTSNNSKVIDEAGNAKNPSRVRDRPATKSRIPKPRYAPRLKQPNTNNSVSMDFTDSLNCCAHSDPHENAFKNNPLSVTGSTYNSSSISSAGDFLISSEGIVYSEAGFSSDITQTTKLSIASDTADFSKWDNCLMGKTVLTPGTSPVEMTGAYRKMSEGCISADSGHTRWRRSSVNSTSQVTTPSELMSALHITTNTEQQMATFNDITFSDDEEINDLIKNSSVQEKEYNNKFSSSFVASRKPVHPTQASNEDIFGIRRGSFGHHAVQIINKNEPKCQSSPKSSVLSRVHSFSGSKDCSPQRGVVIRLRSQTPDLTTFEKIKTAKRKGTNNDPPLVTSSHGKSVSRTDSWLGSVVHDNKTPTQQKHSTIEISPTDLSPRPLEEFQAILTETRNGIVHSDTPEPPLKDFEMFKKMEKLFEKYREIEMKASVNETFKKLNREPSSEKSDDAKSEVVGNYK